MHQNKGNNQYKGSTMEDLGKGIATLGIWLSVAAVAFAAPVSLTPVWVGIAAAFATHFVWRPEE